MYFYFIFKLQKDLERKWRSLKTNGKLCDSTECEGNSQPRM